MKWVKKRLPLNTTAKCISSDRVKQRRFLTHFTLPHEIAAMYDELEKIGVSTGCITNRQDFPNLGCWQGHCEWYINGEEVENSVFVYSVYEGNPNITRNDYNIYFS